MTQKIALPFTRLDKSIPPPSRAHADDAGWDLRTTVDVVLGPGERVLVPTGLAVAIPVGQVGKVCPRSGLAHRHGVTVLNAPGIVDVGYTGEVRVNLINLGGEPVVLAAGDRVAQLLVEPVAVVVPCEVEHLRDTERGTGGHGSTGVA